jgi:hypothetical protein
MRAAESAIRSSDPRQRIVLVNVEPQLGVEPEPAPPPVRALVE